MSVKRYEPEGCECCYMDEVTDGEFVLYEDHKKIIDRLEKKIKQYEELQTNAFRRSLYGR